MIFVTSYISQTCFTASDTRCLEKREIPTVLEFDEIRRGSYISRDDSNGEVRFVIRDLENFRILTEITILPFFKKLDFLKSFEPSGENFHCCACEQCQPEGFTVHVNSYVIFGVNFYVVE